MKRLSVWEGYGKKRVYLNDKETDRTVKFFAEYSEDGDYLTENFKFNNYEDKASQLGSIRLDNAADRFLDAMIETFGKDYKDFNFDEIKEKLGE